jgi:hypothetical protein
MAMAPPFSDPVPESLRGRADERAVLDGLLADVRQGESRSLILRGEAGIGKTALLEYVVAAAPDLRIARAVGVEWEMELAFAGLHQLCAPMLDRLGRLPAPQRQALEIVFGLRAGAPPDRFLVGLAVLGLLSEVAEERPLLCVVDDAQWLDHASALTLGFVVRRLLAEPVGIVFAAREPGEELQHVPDLEVHGLRNGDARALLGSAVQFMLDERVRDRIVAETRGNPLALLELPRGMTATQLAGGFGVPAADAVPDRIEESFVRRLEPLTDDTRVLLLAASAEPVGDPLLLWRAAERLGIDPEAATGAADDGLLVIGERVMFRHPLVRSAMYRSAAAEERRAVHLALAEATDREADPDRRAWHLAAATAGPDEAVAVELERSAGRAQARGGMAAAAAFLQHAVVLTGDSGRRTDRALAAAEAGLQAGVFDLAHGMLATAAVGPLDELQRARLDLLRAEAAYSESHGSEAPALLLRAAKTLEPLDPRLARETYLDAGAPGCSPGSSRPPAACTTSRARRWRGRDRRALRVRRTSCSRGSRWRSRTAAPRRRRSSRGRRPASRAGTHRLGARDPGAVPRAAQRGRGGRERIPRGDRPAGPHPAAPRARPDAPALRRVAAARAAPRRRPRASARRARTAHGDRHGGVRRPCPRRAPGDGREAAPAHRRDARRADCPGVAHRPARPRRALQPGDRGAPVPQPAHRRVAPAQGLREARDPLAPAARGRAAQLRPGARPRVTVAPPGDSPP